eukprot:CAMPEP_0119496208 /NCGR_PEP_ID=MMETSP1344-20130328/19608_1 /TAXON_ID=236787 /ORGANISM="Florenciella parvula, Strain CCMP2471" /LENGTH=58 /DNA_ID=CAMNT_0007531867 /DNA_START=368 /DNA_END=541 /DNA_ORIENTATION=+
MSGRGGSGRSAAAVAGAFDVASVRLPPVAALLTANARGAAHNALWTTADDIWPTWAAS